MSEKNLGKNILEIKKHSSVSFNLSKIPITEVMFIVVVFLKRSLSQKIQHKIEKLNARYQHINASQRSGQEMLAHSSVENWRSRATLVLFAEPQREHIARELQCEKEANLG